MFYSAEAVYVGSGGRNYFNASGRDIRSAMLFLCFRGSGVAFFFCASALGSATSGASTVAIVSAVELEHKDVDRPFQSSSQEAGTNEVPIGILVTSKGIRACQGNCKIILNWDPVKVWFAIPLRKDLKQKKNRTATYF